MRPSDGEIALNSIVPVEQGIAPRVTTWFESKVHVAHRFRAHPDYAGRDSFGNLKLCPTKPLHDGKRCGAALYDEFGWAHPLYQGKDYIRHLGATT